MKLAVSENWGVIMNLLEAIFLGIIQGFTEFLPISSSGHLILFQRLFNIDANAGQKSILFEVVLHVGTLIPILIVYRKDILRLLRKPFQKLTWLLVVATIPAIIATVLLGDKLDALFATTSLLGFAFVLTGCLLLYADKAEGGNKKERGIAYLDALIIGIVQAIAIIPGISRSGSTITASLSRKLTRETAAKFSFLMSIPAIGGAVVLQIFHMIKGDVAIADINALCLIFGFLASMLAGFLSIQFMLALIKKCKLKYFSIYLFILAAVIFLDKLLLGGQFLG